MRRSGKLVALMLGIGLLTGCSEGGVTGLRDGSPEGHVPQVTAASAVDISGAWNWNDVSQLTMPVFVADLAGIEAEGPITHAWCEANGTMTLFQTGSSFSGVAMTDFQQCTTRGGQDFSSPDAGFPKAVSDGQIRGKSIRFSFANFLITPCPHHAIVSEAQDGVAVALSGAGRCVLPGHPQSESPVPMSPPPGGTSKTLRWEAVRP